MLIGKTRQRAKEIKNKDIANALELPPIKIQAFLWQKIQSNKPLMTMKQSSETLIKINPNSL